MVGIGGKGGIPYAIISSLLIACVRVKSSSGSGESSSFPSSSSSHANRYYDASGIQSIENLASSVRSSRLHESRRRRNAQDAFPFINKRRTRRKQRWKEASPSHSQERDLIVGGSTAPPGRFPYSVSLQLEEVAENGQGETFNVHTCGATLIAMDVLLTAAHCGYRERPGLFGQGGNANFGETKQLFYGADVGAYNLQNGYSGSATYEVDNLLFEKLLIHPNYTGFHGTGNGNSELRLQHDVMLVKLYGGSNKPVARLHNPNTDDEPTVLEELVVTGWGDRNPDFGEPDLPDILHYASVKYIPNDTCEDSNGYTYIEGNDQAIYFDYEGKVSNDMMCAISWDGIDACQGDSGGGLIRLGSATNGKDDLMLGITSWGVTCGDSNFPGVYSRVSKHYDWIRDNVCELSDKPPQYMNCPSKPYPPGNLYSAPVDITITIKFDEFRGESGWLLESIPDFRNVAFRPFGTYASATSVDENNSISETVRIQSGRFYLLTVMDEFADGFCCDAGKGFFRVEAEETPIVPTTLGLLWSNQHALRRAFFVSEPQNDNSNPPAFVTVILTLGFGADPTKFLYLAMENAQYEVMMLYEVQPLFIASDSRFSESGVVHSQVYKVPVFDSEFGKQRYNVISYDDNEGARKASFEVYLGDVSPDTLLISQSGNYGNRNNVARSFVLFTDNDPSPLPFIPEYDVKNAAHSSIFIRDVILFVSFLFMIYTTSSYS